LAQGRCLLSGKVDFTAQAVDADADYGCFVQNSVGNGNHAAAPVFLCECCQSLLFFLFILYDFRLSCTAQAGVMCGRLFPVDIKEFMKGKTYAGVSLQTFQFAAFQGTMKVKDVVMQDKMERQNIGKVSGLEGYCHYIGFTKHFLQKFSIEALAFGSSHRGLLSI